MGAILVADDNRGFAELLRATLEEAGFDVLTASTKTSHDGMRFEQNDVDAAVLDILMPGMSGDAVADRLRQIVPDLPVLLMTGSSGGFAAGGGHPASRKPFPQGKARRGRAQPRQALRQAICNLLSSRLQSWKPSRSPGLDTRCPKSVNEGSRTAGVGLDGAGPRGEGTVKA